MEKQGEDVTWKAVACPFCCRFTYPLGKDSHPHLVEYRSITLSFTKRLNCLRLHFETLGRPLITGRAHAEIRSAISINKSKTLTFHWTVVRVRRCHRRETAALTVELRLVGAGRICPRTLERRRESHTVHAITVIETIDCYRCGHLTLAHACALAVLHWQTVAPSAA